MSGVQRSTRLVRVLGDAAKKLEKARGLGTVGDLLEFLPRRYIDANTSGRLSEFTVGETAVLVATVVSAQTRSMRNRRGRMLEAVIQDADGTTARLVFFRAYGHDSRLLPGVRALFRGKLDAYRGGWQLSHPDYTLVDGEDDTVYEGGLVPLYLNIPGVTDMQLTQSMRLVLDQLDDADDPVPPDVRDRRDLVDQPTAYRLLHLPRSMAEVGRGKRRLRYDEALVVQTALAQSRHRYDAEEAVPRRPLAGGLLAAFDERLPFELTPGQQRVSEEIAEDMARSRPMHRLLQGEVGSGKTIVALRAMLAAVDAGAQAALLAPTEVLAQQHERSIRAMLGDLAEAGMLGGAEHATGVALLTGSMSRGQRERVLLDIATGPVGIVIGTHALIQDQVMFADLGLVVVDEQHRFGVEQRDALRSKALRPPHVLVMTATPIPRTVAMTVFGDMDTSSLTELPRGRQPIASHVVPASRPAWLERAWTRLAEEVGRGHQAYVVCPRIGDADDGARESDVEVETDAEEYADEEPAETPRELHGVYETLQRLREEPALRGLRVEMLHGRMTPEDKDAVMRAFGAGEVDVLVSTTVIEVGVDVPNATAMVVLDADRFGISQLHQLRGRVGRGSAGGLCLLVTESDNPDTVARLEAVAGTTDGFALADLDLELRREGDVLGASQSGRRSGLRLLRLTHAKDIELIEQAREDAGALVTEDPDLLRHPALAELVRSRLDDEQAAFLERG
ncbi:ATP-dependent DNA helicase RecG [Luteipulveratus sp. YIM 133296]|uniref:Probable DNA 3'-5' helicase RecG n=1 Tax=Luteipulveratus flavus TaxID=3031728 RepID=A0ABT6C501_9MICO|nr:ATP-dependent DNA helicase RecG [Luteipulveratus sp. YIM 133296]MDF8263781.1 ATP-dependent DNA helicase RecG [Luteipulveratus sp. YIM 133296]